MDLEKEFLLKCKKHLPETLTVESVNYKLDSHMLLSGGYRIIYAEFDDDFFNFNNKLIDLIYPYNCDKNINEIINECLLEIINIQKEDYNKYDSQLKSVIKYNQYLLKFIDKDNIGIGMETKDVVKWYNENFKQNEEI